MADPQSFDEFYLATRRTLLRQLTSLTADPELAADVLQEAYSRAWQHWGRVSQLRDPLAWVRTVAWRIAISQFRRVNVGRRVTQLIHSDQESVAPDSAHEVVMDVQAALRTLPPEHRRALVLHDLCGLSVSQVAAETGAPQGTVKSRLSRARDKLAAVLGQGYPNDRDETESVP